MEISPALKLYNNIEIPVLGLGTYKNTNPQEIKDSIDYAFEIGYRSIDTASFYGNEAVIGNVIKKTNIPRQQFFITTKLWNDSHGYDKTLKAFNESLKCLKLSYIDMYLIHWPVKGKLKETWKAFEILYNEKKVRAIGVSNFKIHHLEEIINSCNFKPMLNQIELHPFLYQKNLIDFCRKNNILIEAWSPLARGKFFQNECIRKIAEKYMKTPAQVILRWDIENNFITIPKSTHRERILENIKIFDFKLTEEEIAQIDSLNRNFRIGPDPDNINF